MCYTLSAIGVCMNGNPIFLRYYTAKSSYVALDSSIKRNSVHVTSPSDSSMSLLIIGILSLYSSSVKWWRCAWGFQILIFTTFFTPPLDYATAYLVVSSTAFKKDYFQHVHYYFNTVAFLAYIKFSKIFSMWFFDDGICFFKSIANFMDCHSVFSVVVALLLNEGHHQMPSEFHLLLHCFVTMFFLLCSDNQDIIINIISLAVSKIYRALGFSLSQLVWLIVTLSCHFFNLNLESDSCILKCISASLVLTIFWPVANIC